MEQRAFTTSIITPPKEILNPDESINMVEVRKRFELSSHWHIAHRLATILTGTTELRALSKVDRLQLGQEVAGIIRDYGWDWLERTTVQFTLEEQKKSKLDK